jgi:hypothetical protein
MRDHTCGFFAFEIGSVLSSKLGSVLFLKLSSLIMHSVNSSFRTPSSFRAHHSSVIPAEAPATDMVIPTEVSRRFFFSFAPAKESAYAAEESLFAVSACFLADEANP